MIFDYTYCLNEDTCEKRKSCKRWVCNYPENEVIELSNSHRDSYLDDAYCLDDIPFKFDSFDELNKEEKDEK